MNIERQFPIMDCVELQSVPWSLLAPHEEQAKRNHSQTLERLAERGGLSACEAVAVLNGKSYYQTWGEIPRLRREELAIAALRVELKKGGE